MKINYCPNPPLNRDNICRNLAPIGPVREVFEITRGHAFWGVSRSHSAPLNQAVLAAFIQMQLLLGNRSKILDVAQLTEQLDHQHGPLLEARRAQVPAGSHQIEHLCN